MKTLLALTTLFFLCSNYLAGNNKSDTLQKLFPESFQVSVINPGSNDLNDVKVVLILDSIKKRNPDFNPNSFVVLESNVMEIPSQYINQESQQVGKIIIVSDFKAKEKKLFTIRYNKSKIITRSYKQRAYAELSEKSGGKWVNRKYEGGVFHNVTYSKVPSEATDHSFYYRYEGPGWESDKVGYRFYLDWRNANDIYGKKTYDMVLKNVGLDGYESYHNMGDWGMDIFKVGKSLGIGSIAMWNNGKVNMVAKTDSVDCRILASGPLQAQIETRYFGWKVDSLKCFLDSKYSIDAGSRLTTVKLSLKGNFGKLCTGLIKDSAAVFLSDISTQTGWCYMATWGKQSLAGDSLGIAVIFKKKDFVKFEEDKLNHIVILNPDKEGKLVYKFLAAWEQEPGGITTKAAFIKCLKDELELLDKPLVVKY